MDAYWAKSGQSRQRDASLLATEVVAQRPPEVWQLRQEHLARYCAALILPTTVVGALVAGHFGALPAAAEGPESSGAGVPFERMNPLDQAIVNQEIGQFADAGLEGAAILRVSDGLTEFLRHVYTRMVNEGKNADSHCFDRAVIAITEIISQGFTASAPGASFYRQPELGKGGVPTGEDIFIRVEDLGGSKVRVTYVGSYRGPDRNIGSMFETTAKKFHLKPSVRPIDPKDFSNVDRVVRSRLQKLKTEKGVADNIFQRCRSDGGNFSSGLERVPVEIPALAATVVALASLWGVILGKTRGARLPAV
jgi:hypothetical protein